MVKPVMPLHRCLGVMDACPWENLQGHINQTRVQRVKRALEAKAVRGAMRPAAGQQALEECLEQGMRLFLIETGQRRARHRLGPAWQRAWRWASRLDSVSRRLWRPLSCAMNRAVIDPNGCFAQLLAGMVLFCERLKLMSRHQPESLGECRARMRQGLNPSALYNGFSRNSWYQQEDSGLLFFLNCGTAVPCRAAFP